MSTDLFFYREHLTGTLKDLHDELCEHHTATWKKGRPASLLVQIEHHVMALGLLNSYMGGARENAPDLKAIIAGICHQAPTKKGSRSLTSELPFALRGLSLG